MAEAELLTACRFYFEADGLAEKQILEVSGLSAESPPAADAGITGSGKGGGQQLMAVPTRVKFTKLTLKLVATTDIDLYQWYQECNPPEGGSSSWKSNRKNASVSAYNQAGQIKARWEVQQCYPCKYEGPSFKADDGNMANETLEIVHQGIRREPV